MAQEENSAQDERPVTGQRSTDGGEAVRASENRFRREFGPPPFGMFAAGLAAGQENTYLAVNDEFCRLMGYSRRELTGAEFLGDFHPEDQSALEALIRRIISGETSQLRADARMVRKDGELVCVHLTGSAIQPPAGARYLATYVEDATAAEQAKAELNRLEAELQRLRRLDSLGQLADGIAHDFNNMLTVIINYASLVRDEVTVAEATESATRWSPVRWDIEQIEDAADRAKRLIKHLLAFTRREQAQPTAVDIGQLINDATGLLREVLGEHVRIVTRPSAGLWPVETDPGLLEQAIINIALNARDAMPGGGEVTIDATNIDTVNSGIPAAAAARQSPAELAELFPGHYVEVCITDTGAGMDAITAERAFEPFFTTKPGDQAAGLGLPAVRRIAAQAGGKAWLRSAPGNGTTITMMLPAAGSTVTRPLAGHPGWNMEQAGAVLVIDDEAAVRDVAHRVLSSAGYQVTTAASGQEALSLLADPQRPADLLLTDVIMPGMTARAFAARAQEIRPGIRLLFMSGYEGRGTAAQGWPHAGEQVVAKPFSRAALLVRVSQALAESDSQPAATSRIRLLPVSAISRLPAPSTATPSGTLSPALVARPPSPENP